MKDLGVARDEVSNGNANMSAGVPGIVVRLKFFYDIFRNIAVVVAIYAFFFLKRNRKLISIIAISTLIYPIFNSILYIMRSQIFLQVLTIIFFLIIFKNRLTRKLKRRIIVYGGSAVGLVALSLIIISNGRFGSLETWMYYKYMGETFVNYSGQLWPDFRGTTDGYAYFRWLLYRDDWKSLPEKWGYMYSHTGVDAHLFYGAIGQLNFEFGFIATALIYILISYIAIRVLKTKSGMSLSNLLIISLISQMLFYGLYVFPFQGTAVIQVFAYIIAIIYFRCNQRRLIRLNN